VGSDGVYRLSPDGSSVWKYTGTQQVWSQIGGPASAIYVGWGGLYATNPHTGDLWRWKKTPMSWDRISGPGKAFVAGAFGVYRLSADGSGIWKHSGQGDVWSQVGGPSEQIAASATTLFATNPQTKDVWAYTAPEAPPAPVLTLKANPPTIAQGECATLAWSTSNAISCDGSASLATGGKTSGLATVCPSATTTYDVSCKGFEGTRSSESTTVAVGGPSTGPVSLVGVYRALNVGTKQQDVTLLVSGRLLTSAGTGGRTSFSGEKTLGTLPPGLGSLPAAEGQVQFTVKNLQRGKWRIRVDSDATAAVECDVPLPSLSINFNATGAGAACP
jgi:hypothetical protein